MDLAHLKVTRLAIRRALSTSEQSTLSCVCDYRSYNEKKRIFKFLFANFALIWAISALVRWRSDMKRISSYSDMMSSESDRLLPVD